MKFNGLNINSSFVRASVARRSSHIHHMQLFFFIWTLKLSDEHTNLPNERENRIESTNFVIQKSTNEAASSFHAQTFSLSLPWVCVCKWIRNECDECDATVKLSELWKQRRTVLCGLPCVFVCVLPETKTKVKESHAKSRATVGQFTIGKSLNSRHNLFIAQFLNSLCRAAHTLRFYFATRARSPVCVHCSIYYVNESTAKYF